ncbi:MAG: DUF3575 domain-containing protein [Vicingaceae bacterium]
MKKLTLLCLVLLAQTYFISAQEIAGVSEPDPSIIIQRPNVVKINSLAIAFSNASFIYERAIRPRLSVALGIGYKFTGSEPNIFTVNNSVISANLGKIKGISITPELRYYLRTCDASTLEGFYGGLYFRYNRNWTDAQFDYFPENSPAETSTSEIALREFGVGIELGYQILIKERLSIDFLFFGPRFSSYTLNYAFDQTSSDQFIGDLSDYLNEVADRFGFDYDIDIKKEGQKDLRTSFGFMNMRFGLSLGYAF